MHLHFFEGKVKMLYLIGDPTDTSIKLRPLEPASGQALARDLVLKTRRRKGLGDQISVSKYLDDEFVVSFCVIIDLFIGK